MSRLAVLALRAVIVVGFAGALFVQCVMVPLIWINDDDADASLRLPFTVFLVLGIATLQVVGVCIWRLLTLVRRDAVFSPASFRYVDVVIGAIGAASALTFGLAVAAAHQNRTTPGDEIAPGVVLLMCGAALVIAGVALVVVVLRALLAQAVSLRTELAGVI